MRKVAAVLLLLLVWPLAGQRKLIQFKFRGEVYLDVLESERVPGPVEYSVLLPNAYKEDDPPLPLLILLAGQGGNAADFGGTMVVDLLMELGRMFPMVAVTPTVPHCLYVNRHDGAADWEDFVLQDLIPEVPLALQRDPGPSRADHHGSRDGRRGRAANGLQASGNVRRGVGARPHHHARLHLRGCAQGEPHRGPAAGVRRGHLRQPVDADGYWTRNNVSWLAKENAARIRKSRLAIYFDCGTRDDLGLDAGAKFLKSVLDEAGVRHDSRLVIRGKHDRRFFAEAMERGAAFVSAAIAR